MAFVRKLLVQNTIMCLSVVGTGGRCITPFVSPWVVNNAAIPPQAIGESFDILFFKYSFGFACLTIHNIG